MVFLDEEFKDDDADVDDVNIVKKVRKLIRWIGEGGYDKLKTLSAPKQPLELKYAELKKILTESVDPVPTVMSKRLNFIG